MLYTQYESFIIYQTYMDSQS